MPCAPDFVAFPPALLVYYFDKIQLCMLCTVWKVCKCGVISGPYFSVFILNTEIYSVNLPIQSECRKIRTRNNSVFGHFSRSVNNRTGKNTMSRVKRVFLLLLFWRKRVDSSVKETWLLHLPEKPMKNEKETDVVPGIA